MGFAVGCECEICKAIDAASLRLVEAEFATDVHMAEKLIKEVVPYSINAIDAEALNTLQLLAGFHGPTFYKMLLARKNV